MPKLTTPLLRNGVRIDASFAEAFGMRATAVIITAPNLKWARQAAVTMTGFATSVIGCGCEAGIDAHLSADITPDGRPGVRVLIFAMSTDALQKALSDRVGQAVLTCPGTACYNGLAGSEGLELGDALRGFADGFQISKRHEGRHIWRLPVMDGEFLCEATCAMTRDAVGGGNLLVMGASPAATMRAAEAGVAAMQGVAGAIMPFPGGIVRSGSKVGSKYPGQSASTNEAYCPSLRGAVASALDDDVASVLEIVIDGLDYAAVAAAMRAGLKAMIALGPERGAVRIGAGNYGGKLGPHHFHLADLVP
ncbi:MAG: formylmethanofuran--tetrahydromethanopterin N-formyltransferase [Hyphomicrobiales bacterium]|nr:formylmethanofuran--tetrahydromethanopterin N-formyltransferase [Hyphomicrobiales bacterium]